MKEIMQNQQLVDFLRECGICKTCELRYLKARGNEYKESKEYLEKLNVKYDSAEATEDIVQIIKKPRRSVCPTCLGLFSSEFQEQLINGILATNIKKYDCNSLVVAISMPMLLQVRQLAMWFALIRKFGDDAIDAGRCPDVPLKEAVKLIINPIICEQFNKSYDTNGIMVNINLSHAQESADVASLTKLHGSAFPAKNGKRQEKMSRGVLEKMYLPTRLTAEKFEEYFSIPPTIPSEELSLESVSLMGPTVYVAGRYRKIARGLSHTPWVLNGQRIIEDSIEEIIIRSVVPNFCVDHKKVIFMSSGREDVDVRCLGKGRPFVLEIPNSLHTMLAKETAHRMENEIEKPEKISVCNLQMVQRDELVHIKTGEEKKRKYYRALCRLNTPATVEMLEKLNQAQGFEIQQKTPLRVLHRRPLHTRPRMIYELKAHVQREHTCNLVLDIVSQAGTYIKELVHGEFGRTTPSIASIIGQEIDIIALDVVGIDLDWPAEIDNSI